MKKLLSVCLVVSLVFACVGLGHSSAENETCNWSCFKGNAQRTGVAPDDCSPDTGRLRLLWKYKIGSSWTEYVPGFSPIVIYDRVIVASIHKEAYSDKPYSGILLSIPLDYDGDEDDVFKIVIPESKINENKNDKDGASIYSTPTYWNNHIFFGNDSGMFYSVELLSGRFGDPQEYDTGSAEDIRSSPVITEYDNDYYVIFGSDNTNLYCLDALTLDEEWVYKNSLGEIFSAPAVSKKKEDASKERVKYVYFLSGSDSSDYRLRLYQIKVSDGEPSEVGSYKEFYEFESGIDKTFSSPVFWDDYILVGASDGKLYRFEYGKLVPKVLYEGDSTLENEIESTPSIYESKDGNVYAIFGTQVKNNSSMLCVNIEDSTKKWEYSPETERFIRSSPAICDGRVYFGCHDGKVYCVDAESGEAVWHYQTPLDKDDNPRAINSSPAVADGKILIVSED